jgi:hypothetical protein
VKVLTLQFFLVAAIRYKNRAITVAYQFYLPLSWLAMARPRSTLKIQLGGCGFKYYTPYYRTTSVRLIVAYHFES